jgi:hypothetical protein
VEEDLLQGVHRSRFRLSFEGSVQRKSSKLSSRERVVEISKERDP